jgi:hypothetical protein
LADSSLAVIAHAKQRLVLIDPNTATLHVSKQTARWILHSQEDWVAEFQKEGVLTEKEAFHLQHGIRGDLDRLGTTEWLSILVANVMYKLEHMFCHVACGSDAADRNTSSGSAAQCIGPGACKGDDGADSSSEHGSDVGLEMQLRVERVRTYNEV